MWISRIFTRFPGGLVVKNLPTNARDPCSIPGSGRSPGIENGNPLQYSCLGNPMDRGTWRATVHGVTRVGHDLENKQSNSKNFVVVRKGKRISEFISVIMGQVLLKQYHLPINLVATLKCQGVATQNLSHTDTLPT